MKNTKIFIFIIALTVFGHLNSTTAQIAIVVNKDNSTNNLSLEVLKRIYLGKITVFPSGKNIILCEYAPLKKRFYQKVLSKTIDKVKKHWFSVVFSGKSATPPREFKDIDEIKNFVSKNDGAICFVEFSSVDSSSVKVLTLENIKPVETAYPLK